MRFKQLSVISLIIFGSFLTGRFINAASQPQIMFSWSAQSFIPNWYQGKVLATTDTPIKLNFELVNAGKILNISREKVRWYINDNLIANETNGLGIKRIDTSIPPSSGYATIRIVIFNYQGSGTSIDEIFRIPVVSPEVVIQQPIGGMLRVGTNTLEAFPFFFNVKTIQNLSVDWQVNNERISGLSFSNPWLFNLEIPSDVPATLGFNIKTSVSSKLNSSEMGIREIRLNLK